MRDLTRRDVLAGTTALGAVALAGCVANDSDGGDNNPEDGDNGNSDPENEDPNEGTENENPDEGTNDPGTEDSDEGTNETLELVETRFTSGAVARSPNDRAEATITDGAVSISGAVPVSTPCHEAVLSDASLDEGRLSVAVDVEDTNEGQTCAQVISSVEYEVTLGFSQAITDLSPFSSVTVEHGGQSGTVHTISETGVVAGDGQTGRSGGSGDGDGTEAGATVLGHSIRTVETGCASGAGDKRQAVADTEFSRSDGVVTVSESLTASNPCHEAYIERVGYDDGTLLLTVGAEKALEEGQYCAQCLGEIQYEASVEVAPEAAVETVSVTHLGPDTDQSRSSP
jgi:hypothetical protein